MALVEARLKGRKGRREERKKKENVTFLSLSLLSLFFPPVFSSLVVSSLNVACQAATHALGGLAGMSSWVVSKFAMSGERFSQQYMDFLQ
jgi:hypothetical protein